jgi:hypothetical protein
VIGLVSGESPSGVAGRVVISMEDGRIVPKLFTVGARTSRGQRLDQRVRGKVKRGDQRASKEGRRDSHREDDCAIG